MSTENEITLNFYDFIGQKFYDVFESLEKKEYMTCILKGGRGSFKGSFVYLYTIRELTKDAENGIVTHAVGLRKIKDTVRDSIYTNLIWAITTLKLDHVWAYQLSPLKIWHKRTGNTILFRGCANQLDHKKIKSIKFTEGYCKFAIFEETSEFAGSDEIDDILQSLIRSGDESLCFMMYNPPPSANNWINYYVNNIVKLQKNGMNLKTLVHHSTYEDIGENKIHWLGKQFVAKALQIKELNPKKYRHMYLGEETGEGLEIYPLYDPNTKEGVLELREISDTEIQKFDDIDRGLDFGYSHASCYSECYYDELNEIVYVFDEVYLYGASNKTLYIEIIPKSKGYLIIGDSEDPRTINELTKLGLNVIGAKKGADSKDHGIKWLTDRTRIVVDPKRCPNIAYDLKTYERKKDPKTGKIIWDYPDEPDGSASIRYGLEQKIINSKWETC